jgi:glycosyltransferase involved in cell wall biosynthesis
VFALYILSEQVIWTIPLSKIFWLPHDDRKSFFIPLAANVPECLDRFETTQLSNPRVRRVTIFCLSPPPSSRLEVQEIADACEIASASFTIHLTFVGRGTHEARTEIETAFRNSEVEVFNLGMQDSATISKLIAQSDVLVCVRGILNMRRGSALAGVACGTPIVGYDGMLAGTPLIEAGIIAVPPHDVPAVGRALVDILSNPEVSNDLRERNIEAQKKYFSWNALVESYLRVLANVAGRTDLR